jgi:hypothetical protein
MMTFAFTGGLDGLDGPPSACASADDRVDVFATGSGNTVWRWSWDGVSWAPPVAMPALGKIPAEGVCAVSSGPGRVEVFAAEANNHTPVWWRGDHGSWLPGPTLPAGANLPAVPVAAVCASPNDIDVFAAGAGNTPWWWHWNGAAWSLMGPLPGGANLPAEPIAAVSPAPGRLDVFAAGAGNHLWHWSKVGAGVWGLEDLGGNLPAGGVSAVSWGTNRIDVFAASRNAGNPLWHWWSNGGGFANESLGGSLAPGAVSAVSSAANRLDVFGIAANQRLARWSWDGARWAGPDYQGENLPAGDVSAVVRKPHNLDVFVVGAGRTLRKWPARGIESATTEPWLNWPTNRTVNPPFAAHLWPESLEELVDIVRAARRLGRGVRAVGSSWSNSDVAVSPAYVVETKRLNRILSNVLDTSLRADSSTLRLVHVEAGIKLDELNTYLDGRSLALSTMGGSSGQSLAGVVSTSAHGMDIDRGPIPDMVRAIHLVGPDGSQHWIEPTQGITTKEGVKTAFGLLDANIHYDDDWFNSVLVSMGSMGIIYSLIVEVVPQYDLVDTREALDWSLMKARLRGGAPDPFAGNRGVQVVIDIYPRGDGSRTCYLTTRQEVRPPTVKLVPANDNWMLELFTPGLLSTFNANRGTVDDTLWELTKLRQKIPPDGPGWGHSVMGGPDPGPVRGLTVEVVFDATNTKYLDFIDSALQVLYDAYYTEPGRPAYLGWISLRFQGHSRAYLSPHNMSSRTCTVEFAAMYRMPHLDIGWSDTRGLLTRIEAKAREFNGIQHWGMNDGINDRDVAGAYPRLDTWRRIRWELTDGGTIKTFDNEFTRRCGLSNPPADAPVDWESLGGVLTSGAGVCSWAPGRLDVFARGGDNALWHRWYENSWSGWESLGGVLSSDPAAVSWGHGRIDVFAKGTDNTLQHRWYDGTWSGWESLGGALSSGPTVSSWAPGRLDVFARGADNTLHHKWYENNWSGWESLGGGLSSDPAAVSWGHGRIDVFAKGGDNALWHKWYDGNWSGWESLGGSLTSGPGVSSWASGRLDVFARGTDNGLYHMWYENNWSAWEFLGGELASDPDAVSWDKGRIDVFAKGINNALWHRWYDGNWKP